MQPLNLFGALITVHREYGDENLYGYPGWLSRSYD